MHGAEFCVAQIDVPLTDLRVAGTKPHRLVQVCFGLFVMAERRFGDAMRLI